MHKERTIIWFATLIQFINMMDFMMVMPLGPDIAKALPVTNADIGLICGSYTIAVSLSGVLCACFLDRFDRKHVALAALAGLGLATVSSTWASGLWGLIGTRAAAGIFGGPAAAIALTMATDVAPRERRGKAIAMVMGAFAISSIVAVPFGLELARLGSWKSPFYVIAGLAGLGAVGVLWAAPSMTGHLIHTGVPKTPLRGMLRSSNLRLALLMMGSAMFSSFLIIPNISAFFQLNRGFPRTELGTLYMLGGGLSFVLMQLGGRLSDRIGPVAVNLAGTGLLLWSLADGFLGESSLSLYLVFILFMGMVCLRNVAATAEATTLVQPQERASFLSLLSAVQHLGNGLGAFVSSAMLVTAADGRLEGMAGVGLAAILAALVQPCCLLYLHRVRITKAPAPCQPA